jgi:hypothetical protein
MPVDELAHLALADEHISAGEVRITRQISLIQWLADDTGEAENLLLLLESSKKNMLAHRRLILDAISKSGTQPSLNDRDL